ncbi:hypothetical protein Q0M94_07515 [Deinococcus radiomollis]|uniref:hypothetical protein n=1 Tax=Deinococcus radiomollis TaxID=468916 RepID=UPI00389230B1
MQLNLKAFEAKLTLYALQAVAAIEHETLDLAQKNLATFESPEKADQAVETVMGLYQVFEAGVPVLAATTLDDLVVKDLARKAVQEAFSLVGGALNSLSAQVKAPVVAPVVNAPELPSGAGITQ